MKLNLPRLALGLLLTASAGSQAASYTVTNVPGWNLIANQLDSPNGNNVRNVFPGGTTPIGSQLMKYDLASKSFLTLETLTAAAGWLPGTNILNAGEGIYFSNNLATTSILTFTGNPHVPVLPLNLGPGPGLVARQANDLGTVTNILGFAPPNFTIVYRYNAGPGHDPGIFAPPHYTIYALKGGAWMAPNGAPVNLRVGESAWVSTNGTAPTILLQPASQTVCPGSKAGFTIRASGTPPLTYQWQLNGTNLPNATNASYSVAAPGPADLGIYGVQVTNPFGTSSSSNAVLNFISPPTADGPTNTGVCPGGTAMLSTSPSGFSPFTFAWFHNGVLQPNQTGSVYFIFGAGAADAGTYCVVVRDGCGTPMTNCATVTVGDFTPPALTCPADLIISCGGTNGTRVTWQVGISDNCDTNPVVTSVPAPGSLFPFGKTTVVCTGRDASGNSNVCSFNVTVVDDLPPTIVCPPDQMVIAGSSNGMRVTFTVAAFDACDPSPTVVCNPPSGSLFPVGTTPVTCIAKDAAGNRSACAFNVTVLPPSCCQGKFWKQFDAGGPAARGGQGMAYDSARGRVVMFGGSGGSGLLGDTWEWDGAAWSLMATSGPSARTFTAMVYDSRISRTVLFGGNGAKSPVAETWEWDGVSWRMVEGAGPSARYGHAMAFDSARSRTVLFGGFNSTLGGELGDTWEFDGARWFSIPAGSVSPSPRLGHAMAYGSAQGQMILFGGTQKGTVLSDTWQWDGKYWTQLQVTGPSARGFHALAYHDNCDRIVLYGGGASATVLMADTWEWDGAVWTQTFDKIPPQRLYHAMAHDSAHRQTLLFGGVGSSGGYLSDTWAYGTDQTVPRVISAYVVCGDNRILVAFSKPVSAASAQDPANYQILCGGLTVPIAQILISDDARLVSLVTAQPIPAGQPCVLIVNGVEDACGHVLRAFQYGFACAPDPCPRGSAGTEYWLTFPGNYAPDQTNQPLPQLFITGSAGTIGAVSLPGLPVPFLAPFTIPAGGEVTVTLPAAADLGDSLDMVENRGIHVVASIPVSVYGYNHIRYTTDAYLGLSTKAIGKAYMVLAYQNVFSAVPELNGVQFALVAAQDATTVTIVPSSTVGPHAAGVPYSLTLMRGQTYQLRNTNAAAADLSGTIVVADQPIAVFGSHPCANLPTADVFFCNYLVEQLPPAESWGNNFVTVPLQTRLKGDTFRMMALWNATTVRTNGVALPGLLNRGQFFETRLATSAQITSDKPILVAQYANSSDFDLVDDSDPFMVLIPPTTLFASSYSVETPGADFTGNFINVVSPAAGVGDIALDGGVISPAFFSPIGASGYSGAQVPVGIGPHTLMSGKGVPFGVIVYGWAQYDAYGYPGGTCAARQVQPPQFTCPPTNLVLQLGPGCTALVPDLTAQVGNAGFAVTILQSPPAGTPVGPGTYPVTLTIVDQLGERHLCSTTLTVPPSSTPGLQCPPNLATNCASPQGRVIGYQVGLCNTNFTVTYDPPPGSLFPPGVTVVNCTAGNAAGAIEKCSFTVTVTCVTLGISQTGNNLTLTWQGGGTLQKASTLVGPWVDIPGAQSPYTVSFSGAEGYFRLAP